MDVFDALKPKQIDQISQKSNTNQFYKQVVHKKFRTSSLQSNQNFLQSNYNQNFQKKSIQDDKKFCRQNIKNQLKMKNLPLEIKQFVQTGSITNRSEANSDNQSQKYKFLLNLLEEYIPKQQNNKQEVNFTFLKKQPKQEKQLIKYIDQLLENSDDHLTLEYIAHLLRICQCYKCECTQCKCPYAFNNEQIKYPIKAMNKQKIEQLNTNLNTRIDYEIKGLNEDKIDSIIQFQLDQTQYQINYIPHNSQIQNQQKKIQKKDKYEFCYQSQYQINFQNWNKEENEQLNNLNQIQVQYEFNNDPKKSNYQENFIQQPQQKQTRLPQEIKNINYKQPFQYQTFYQYFYKGENKYISQKYPQDHRIQQKQAEKDTYLSENRKKYTKKQDQSLFCQGKNKIDVKESIREYLQK